MKKVLKASFITTLCILLFTTSLFAQDDAFVQQYIERYRNLAMSEQQRSGIPAAIKLAQAIHESGAGRSELAVNANNHFGIKCKAGWTGLTYQYTDDRPNECFRKYNLDFGLSERQSEIRVFVPEFNNRLCGMGIRIEKSRLCHQSELS